MTESRSATPRVPAVEFAVPLVWGGLLVAVGWVTSAPRGLGLAHLGVLLALGAFLPGPPLRAGALASLPLVVAGLATAARGSAARLAFAVVFSPFALLAGGLVATAGVLVGDYVREEVAARGSPGRPAARPARFETKVQRGRFLLGVFVLLGVGGWLVGSWGAGAADDQAGRREKSMGQALRGVTPSDYAPATAGLGGLPGGPYRSVRAGPDGLHVSDQVRVWLQSRCVRADVTPEGRVSTSVSHTAC